jgi:hypothetical protein
MPSNARHERPTGEIPAAPQLTGGKTSRLRFVPWGAGLRCGFALLTLILAIISSALLVAGCTTGAMTTPPTSAPLPAGQNPSDISRRVCMNEALQKFDAALGERATVSTPTWIGHLYSCTYGYPSGSMVVSVKELSSWAQIYAYFQMLATQMGKARTLQQVCPTPVTATSSGGTYALDTYPASAVDGGQFRR